MCTSKMCERVRDILKYNNNKKKHNNPFKHKIVIATLISKLNIIYFIWCIIYHLITFWQLFYIDNNYGCKTFWCKNGWSTSLVCFLVTCMYLTGRFPRNSQRRINRTITNRERHVKPYMHNNLTIWVKHSINQLINHIISIGLYWCQTMDLIMTTLNT